MQIEYLETVCRNSMCCRRKQDDKGTAQTEGQIFKEVILVYCFHYHSMHSLISGSNLENT
jgi:hypothetical protein